MQNRPPAGEQALHCGRRGQWSALPLSREIRIVQCATCLSPHSLHSSLQQRIWLTLFVSEDPGTEAQHCSVTPWTTAGEAALQQTGSVALTCSDSPDSNPDGSPALGLVKLIMPPVNPERKKSKKSEPSRHLYYTGTSQQMVLHRESFVLDCLPLRSKLGL